MGTAQKDPKKKKLPSSFYTQDFGDKNPKKKKNISSKTEEMKNHSPPHPHAEQFSEQKGGGGEMMVTEKRLCDFCGERRALLYCRPDSAKLCFSCDREVHSTNQLFTKHARSLLCDSCDSSPSSILCSTENLVLCQNCDWEKHNRSFSAVHDRRPLEGFSGCPSANDLSSILGFDEGLGDKALFPSNNGEMVDLFSDFLVWDTPSIVTLDDLIVPADSEHNFQAMGVPPLPKNRKAICGQHKDEMLRQLRELSRLEPGLNYCNEDVEPLNGLPSVVPEQNLQSRNVNAGHEHDAEATPCPSFGAHAFQWCSNSGEAANEVVPSSFLRSYIEETPKDGVKHSERSYMEETPKDGVKHSERSYIEETPKDGVKHSEIGANLSLAHVSASHEGQSQDLNPITTGILPVLPRVPSHELTAQERETAISRYKEKRKTRRYEKHIRYESRKVRAESRTRIRGRFAKMDR